jgi:hypothetical protein
VATVVAGGIATIGIALASIKVFPDLARMGRLEELQAREARAVHASPREQWTAASVWPYVDGEPGDFVYSRYAHPTGVEAERKLAALEAAPDGQALLFASGSAATTALLLALLEPGQTVALAEGAYFGTGLIMGELGRWGATTRRVRPDRPAARGRRPDLVGGPVEPVPDDARPRGRRGSPGAAGCRLDRGRRPSISGRSSTARTSSCTPRRST